MLKPLYLALLACSCSMIVGAELPDVDQVDDNDNSSEDTADTADTDADSDTDTDTDTDSDADTDTDTDSDTDTDTDSDVCPWTCVKNVGDNACDPDWIYTDADHPPDTIHNWRYDSFCPIGHICCQPIESTEPGAFTDYCLDLIDVVPPVECKNRVLTNPCPNPYPAFCWTSVNRCCEK